MSFSNYTSQATLNSLFGKTSAFGALASRPTFYIALSTTAPTETGGVTEPVGNGYARVATAPADWNAATLADPSVTTNASEIAFPQATGAWGTITHFAVFDAATAGNYLGASNALTTPKSPTSGDTPRFAAGQISFTKD